MLDEKLKDQEELSKAANAEVLVAESKAAQLGTTLQNLKWGFRERFTILADSSILV